MKTTIRNALRPDFDGAVVEARSAVSVLAKRFVYEAMRPSEMGDRHVMLDALSMLDIEIEAKAARVTTTPERRIRLAAVLLLVHRAVERHAWGILAGNSPDEDDAMAEAAKRFAAARTVLTTVAYDAAAASA